MQFINYFFASITSFLGLAMGIMLAKIAPEEQKPLEKYFILSRKILLLLIFIFAAFYYINDYFNLLALLGYFLFLLFAEFKISDLLKKSIITYCVLGILFFLSLKNTNLFTIESSLILLYGLPTASLLYNKKEKNEYNIIFYNIGFVIITNLLFFM
jgi:dolichol kinase